MKINGKYTLLNRDEGDSDIDDNDDDDSEVFYWSNSEWTVELILTKQKYFEIHSEFAGKATIKSKLLSSNRFPKEPFFAFMPFFEARETKFSLTSIPDISHFFFIQKVKKDPLPKPNSRTFNLLENFNCVFFNSLLK